VIEPIVDVKFTGEDLRCEYWAYGDEAGYHWKVKLGPRGLFCYKKDRWNGSRWETCQREEVPGPVWDKITLTLSNVAKLSIQVRTIATAESAARMGIKL
jgi:hypothetical protein